MATVDQSSGINGGTHPSRAIRKMPYKIETDVNLATVTTTKGSAIGSADVIQVLDIPGKSLLYAAGLEMVTVGDGHYTVDLGVSTVDADNNVDGVLWGSSIAAGTITQQAAAYQPVVVGSDLTLDLTIAAAATQGTALPTTGVFRAWAVLQDISNDVGPDEVDRDQLA
jgi:hypothetical protein|tara:strand:+ start:680 stop:1183 length:504 start_codon:yes stop_codon:yes gene_type:complete